MKVELRLFRVYVRMLPRLRAEETMAALNTGHAYTERPMPQRARGEYVAALEKQVSGERRGRRLGKGDLQALAHMGVTVRREGAAAEAEGEVGPNEGRPNP